MNKFKNIIFKIFKIVLLIMVASILMGLIYHNIYLPNKIAKIEDRGEFIEVDNKNLHVYKKGSSDKTVVLLSGHGVALPYADFGPLIRELEDDYTVVVVEYFGVGLSDITDNKRDNEEMVKEVRAGLKGVGLEGPYILVPHSISYVYSEYYAKTYPNEVEGIFVLDGTVPSLDKVSELDESMDTINKTFKTMGIMQKLGIQDFLYNIALDGNAEEYNLPYSVKNKYTEEEISNLKMLVGRNINKNMLDQLGSLKPNIIELSEMPVELETPVFKVIASESFEQTASIEHLKALNKDNEYEIVEGTHFIYHNNEVKIKELLDKFIENID